MVKQVVTPDNLGSEFDQGSIESGKIRLKAGPGVTVEPDGTVTLGLTVTKKPLYEYRELWAEENAAISTGQAEYSYGNGAVGYIGIPFDAGWEVTELGFNADVFAAAAVAVIDLMNYNTPSDDTGNIIDSLSITGSSDGGGSTNNAYKHHVVPTPIVVPEGLIGFFTRSVTGGTVSDVRVWARFRRKVGDYIDDIALS